MECLKLSIAFSGKMKLMWKIWNLSQEIIMFMEVIEAIINHIFSECDLIADKLANQSVETRCSLLFSCVGN